MQQATKQPPESELPDNNNTKSSQESNTDFIIYTDGSSHTDKIGGFGAIVVSTKYPQAAYIPVAGACTNIGTDRAEFMAVLSGLWSIVDTMGWDRTKYILTLKEEQPSILVYTDREDLAGSINGVFRRHRNQDLWNQFIWFESHFNIKAKHVKRETVSVQSSADKIASEMRIVLKEFINVQTELNHI